MKLLGALRCGAQRNPRLGCHRAAFLGTLGRGAKRLQVVGRQHAGELVVVERVVEAGRGQVPRASFAPWRTCRRRFAMRP